MSVHHVWRLSRVLLSSQLRSGRSQSDPRSLWGRPVVLVILDLAVYIAVAALVHAALGALGPSAIPLITPYVLQLLALLPVLAVGVVLVAGVMFEFTTTGRFSSSDAANWLPVSPTEYVTASALSVALIYSMAVAFALGAALPLAAALGMLPVYAACSALSVLGLVEGGLLVEMLRSTTQRATSAFSGRKGKVTLIGRAILFLVVILLFEVAFNPVLLLPLLGALASTTSLSAFVPFLWPTGALEALRTGAPLTAAAFVAAQLSFLGVLAWAAAALRRRFWSPSPAEIRLEAHVYGGRHPWLELIGLGRRESALLSKDLTGLVRRREMLPMLVTPIVLAVLGFLQSGPSTGTFSASTMVLWIAFVAGFFALLLSITALGQERRAIVGLFAVPLAARELFRAKLAGPLLLSPVFLVAMAATAALTGALSWAEALGTTALALGAVLVGTFLGLSIAARYSDFQERPRAQYVRPWAMAIGMLGGLGLIFAIVVPATAWIASVNPWQAATILPGLGSALVAAAAAGVLYRISRSGFERFLRELPY